LRPTPQPFSATGASQLHVDRIVKLTIGVEGRIERHNLCRSPLSLETLLLVSLV
jgi:hypothetical protein